MILAAALLCAIIPLDISQLVFLLIGAVAYGLTQPLSLPASRISKGKIQSPRDGAPKKYVPPAQRGEAPRARAAPVTPPKRDPGVIVKTETVKPVAPLSLKANALDAQVEELVATLMPSAAGSRAVEQLVAQVKKQLLEVVPEAKVVGIAIGTPVRNRPFAVAVPDIDIVIGCRLEVLVSRLQAAGIRISGNDQKFLMKSLLRHFTDRLVASGDFKFRRSAFSAEEPKTTLMPSGDGDAVVPVDLSINTCTAVRHAALLAECDRLHPQARALALLVRRWACDRGICKSAKVQLPPYAWTVLALHFLQVYPEEACKLPALADLKLRLSTDEAAAALPDGSKSVAGLFTDFVAFFAAGFDFAAGVSLLSPASGKKDRDARALASIRDPFDETRNLGAGVDAEGLRRLKEEFARAHGVLTSEGASVMKLLEPWVPEDTPKTA
eukprot:SRR837773.463.p1 GENE.SRR837773.463~~SRR837773.463.p1  ORF type:complete len:453 (+),score=155.07 SRR837773.463:45-1361(+)